MKRERRSEPSGKSLTHRERQAIRLLALRTKIVAKRMLCSESTAKFHLENAMIKLDANNRAGAVVQALRLGVLSLDEVILR